MTTLVALQRCPDYSPAIVERALRAALDDLGGMASLLGDAERVLVKPNLLMANSPEKGWTTHPAVVDATLKLIREAGDREITLGDSPAMGSAQRVAKRCGIGEVAARHGVPVLNLSQPVRAPLPPEAEWTHLLVDRRVIATGTRVVNVAKVKVHCQMYLTLAIKNLFGVTPGKRKPAWHISVDADRLRFGRMLIWLHRVVAPAVNIIDGVDAMERRGPRGGDMRRIGMLAASPDAVALDRVVTEVLGLDPSKHHALQSAASLEHGAWSMEQIDVRGAAIEELRVRDFKEAPVANLGFSVPRPARSLIRQVFLRSFPQHVRSQ